MIINYASSIVNKLEALLTEDARVVIHDCQVLIVQAAAPQMPVAGFKPTILELKVECATMACQKGHNGTNRQLHIPHISPFFVSQNQQRLFVTSS